MLESREKGVYHDYAALLRLEAMTFSCLLLLAVTQTAPLDEARAAQAAQIEDPQAATRAYLDAVPAERRAKTKSYAAGNYVLDALGFLFDVLVFSALLAFGFSARMRDRARRWSRFRPLETSFYWIQFLLVTTTVGFPFALYRSYFREKAYGLLTQGFSDWLLDQAKALALGALLGSLFMIVLYRVLRRSSRHWWIWAAAVMVGFTILGVAIAPVFLAPVFNKFTPVENAEIRESVLNLARENRIPADDVYEVDASRRTDRISAYVSGMLGTTRIVLNDTTLKRCTKAEIRMIMAHEMGHYVLNHVWKSIGFLSLVIVLGLLFVRRSFSWAAARWPSFGVTSVADVAGLPLLLILLSTFIFFTSPATNTWGRYLEDQADDFGLRASREPDAAATTFLKLGEYRDLEPTPVVEFLFFDHPSGRSRIQNAMEWKKAN